MQTRVLREKLLSRYEVTIQMDYAENWETKYQNEPSSMYYDKSNTTLHSMVVHFKIDMEELTARSLTVKWPTQSQPITLL